MNQRLMRFKSAFIRDGEMWCVPAVLNWLFKINLKDWSIKSVCNLELEDRFHIDYIYQCQNDVWCITAVGVRVIRYNMLTGKVEHFELTGEDQRRNRGTVLFNGRLWIAPIELPGKMISFDVIKKKFTVHDSWEKECQKWSLSGKAVSFCQVENTIYMTLKDECKVIQFDLEKEGLKIKSLPGKYGLRCIFTVYNNVYATSSVKRKLFQWNKNGEIIRKIRCPYRQNKPYARGMEFGNKILLMDDETVDVFDIETEKITPYYEIDDLLEGGYSPLFFIHMVYGTKYFLIPWRANALLEFDREEKEWTGHILRIPEELFFKEYVLKEISSQDVIMDGELLMGDLVNYVTANCNKKQEHKFCKQIGDDIYSRLSMDIC